MDDGKILGIDYGEKKIGLAISEGEIATPCGVMENRQNKAMAQFCQQNNIEKIIIGLSEGKMAEKTKKFGEELAKITRLPVEYHDETLTSQKAQEKMVEGKKPKLKKKSAEHALAAALILQDYLDNLGP